MRAHSVGRRCLGGIAQTVVIMVTAWGCADRGSGDLTVVTDSAGVALVVNRSVGDELATLYTVGSETLRLGMVDGDAAETFSSISAVRESDRGEILVAESQARELRIFDSSGRHVRTIGGRGEGPGEFVSLSGIAGLTRDTVWLWDSRSQRLTSFMLNGELVGTTPGDGDPYARVSELHRLPDGSFVARSSWNARGARLRETEDYELVRDSLVLRHLDPSLRMVDTIVVLPAAEKLRQVSGRPRNGGTIISTRQTARPLGRSTFVTLSGVSIISGVNDSFEWVVADATGMRRSISRSPGLERAVTAPVVNQFREWFVSSATTIEQERQMTSFVDDYPLPGTLPAFGSIKIDPTGRVWVAQYKVVPTDASIWYVFSASGELMGRAELPADLSVHEIGTDFVLGVRRDEFDVPFVVRLPLVRAD